MTLTIAHFGRAIQCNRQLQHAVRAFSSLSEVVKVRHEGAITTIVMNRPEKMNAIDDDMYINLTAAMNKANADPKTKITVITGAGKAFSAGTDLATFTKGDIDKHCAEILIPYIEAHINHDKPLIALVNGAAIGVAVTTLALYDVVFASDKAQLFTPFGRFGLVAEACSSITFPRLMGSLKAAELLLFDKKLTAKEAEERNLVNEVIPHANFEAETRRRLEAYAKFNDEAMRHSKRLLRLSSKQELLDANRREMQVIAKMRKSEHTRTAIDQFLAMKK